MRVEERIDLVRRSDGVVLSGQQCDVREARLRPQGCLQRSPLRPYYADRSLWIVVAFHKLDVRHPA